MTDTEGYGTIAREEDLCQAAAATEPAEKSQGSQNHDNLFARTLSAKGRGGSRHRYRRGLVGGRNARPQSWLGCANRPIGSDDMGSRRLYRLPFAWARPFGRTAFGYSRYSYASESRSCVPSMPPLQPMRTISSSRKLQGGTSVLLGAGSSRIPQYPRDGSPCHLLAFSPNSNIRLGAGPECHRRALAVLRHAAYAIGQQNRRRLHRRKW